MMSTGPQLQKLLKSLTDIAPPEMEGTPTLRIHVWASGRFEVLAFRDYLDRSGVRHAWEVIGHGRTLKEAAKNALDAGWYEARKALIALERLALADAVVEAARLNVPGFKNRAFDDALTAYDTATSEQTDE